jgi:hypothetical protein
MNVKAMRIAKISLTILLTSILAITILQAAFVNANGSTVMFYHEDTVTGGDWPHPLDSPVGTYGSYARILPNPDGNYEQARGPFSVPLGFDLSNSSTWALLKDPPYNWSDTQIGGLPFYQMDSPYTDEYVTQSPPVTYYLNGTEYLVPEDGTILYPAFEWNWTDWHSTQTDGREVYYNNASGTCAIGWKYNAWDDGGERCQPVHGYFNVTMHFPNGTWLLSLYGYDYEGERDSEQYLIYDGTGSTLLASARVNGTVWDNGVYETFSVVAPEDGLDIVIQVYNDAGHDENYTIGTYNVLLSGIFVDPLPPTGGFLFGIDKLGLLGPFLIGLAAMVVVPAAVIVYVKHKKQT